MALVGPLVAIVMVVVMAALLHRSLHSAESGTKPVKDTGPSPDDYGLLAPAAVTRTRPEALRVKQQLRSAGIRSTLAATPDGQVQVLVFGDQVVRARRLVGWSGQKP